MKSIKDIFGENLKRIRKAKGWTQETLSEESGLSMGTIQHLELGDRWIGVDTLETLSSTLGVDQTDFFSPRERQPTPLEALSIIEKALKSQLQKTGENLQQTIEKAPHHIPANQKPELPAEYVEIIEALKARPLKIDEVRAALGITAARVVSRSPAKKDQS